MSDPIQKFFSSISMTKMYNQFEADLKFKFSHLFGGVGS